MLFRKILGNLCKNRTKQTNKHTVWLNAEFLVVAVINKLTAGLELNKAVWFCFLCSVYFIILNCANWLGIFPFISSFAFWSVIAVTTF
jgi:hypothetical protein